MGLIDTLKAAGQLMMYFDFRQGTSEDLSENSWASSILSGASLVTDHLECNDTGYLEMEFDPGFISETGSVVILGNFKTEDGGDTSPWPLVGLGLTEFGPPEAPTISNYWSLQHTGTTLSFQVPSVEYAFSTSPYNHKMISATFENGVPVKFYLNEGFVGSSSSNYATGAGTGFPNFRIGYSTAGGASNTTSSDIYAVIYTTRILSATEVATLYKELSEDLGLLIYRDAGSSTYVAYIPNAYSDKTYIETTLDCELGQAQETEYFIRNDDKDYYFTDISVKATSLIAPDDTIGIETGWGVKLSAGATQPTEAQWETIDYGNTISLSDLGSALASDTTTYLPFWVRVECPAGIMPTIKENIAIDISYTKTAI